MKSVILVGDSTCNIIVCYLINKKVYITLKIYKLCWHKQLFHLQYLSVITNQYVLNILTNVANGAQDNACINNKLLSSCIFFSSRLLSNTLESNIPYVRCRLLSFRSFPSTDSRFLQCSNTWIKQMKCVV